MSTHIIIQARLGGTRLPGKIMQQIGGLSALEHVVRRASLSGAGRVTIAMPRGRDLSAGGNRFRGLSCDWFQGDEDDVLGRIYGAAEVGADVIVRLTADCPFVPVAAIEEAVAAVKGGADFAETRSDPSTRPNGIDVQAFRHAVLSAARFQATTADEREHVTPALHRAATKRRTVGMVEGVKLDDLPPWRLTLDTPEDLAWFRAVAAYIDVRPPHPTLRELVQLFHDHPELERMDT